MANRNNITHNGPGLFAEQDTHFERRLRRQRALFIPRFLQEAAANLMLKNAAQDRAHEIAIRQTRGQASTEELRQAMIHYRTLFEELVAEPEVARAKAAS